MMAGKAIGHFKEMRPSVRALLYIYWIYSFTGSLIGVFTQIYLYQKFTSLELNILATIIFYTGIMIGFCIPGFLAGVYRVNIKHGFLAGFIVGGASIFYLLHASSLNSALLAMFFWGTGQGVFWLTVNTFELTETEDHERDLYSSALNAGNQMISLLGPACASLLIWLSSTVFRIGEFSILFTVTPLVYLVGFLFFAKLRNYVPEPLEWADIVHFFKDKKNQAAQLYTVGNGFQQTLGITIPPLVLLTILGTALRVGIYDTIFAIFSAVCVLIVAQYRNQKNRLLIYALTSAIAIAATIFLGYEFSLLALIIYTFVDSIISPIRNVSSHVIDLSSMEIGRSNSDFYATMILRDFSLWIWRTAGGILFLLLASSFHSEHDLLTVGLYLFALSIGLTYAGAYLFVKTPHTN